MTAKTLQLNAHLAVDARIRKDAHELLTALHRDTKNEHLMSGLLRTYEPTVDGGAQLPPEPKKVQLRSQDAVAKVREALGKLFDTTAVRDYTNTAARADIVVEGTILLEAVPVTYLMVLTKELKDLHTFVEKIVEPSPEFDWTRDEQGLLRTGEVRTAKTAKVEETVITVPATDKHPAQTRLVTTDKVVGYWTQIRLSGGMLPSQKEEILKRLGILEAAVKVARERANMIEVKQVEVGAKLLNYVFDAKLP